jgi:hypothetical protein
VFEETVGQGRALTLPYSRLCERSSAMFLLSQSCYWYNHPAVDTCAPFLSKLW